jgi:hypothetical protein
MHNLIVLGIIVDLELELARKEREPWYVISSGRRFKPERWCETGEPAPRAPHLPRTTRGRILGAVGDALIATGLWLSRHAADGQSA